MTKKIQYNTSVPKERSVYDGKCPIIHSLEIIGGKWKLPIIWYLSEQKTIRYNELRRSIKGITNMMLTKCLKELEGNGIVLREQFNEIPPHVEYSLTERGKKLLPALNSLYKWGKEQIQLESTNVPQQD